MDLLVGARGFEPPASASRTLRANQAALRPVDIYYRPMKAVGQVQGNGERVMGPNEALTAARNILQNCIPKFLMKLFSREVDEILRSDY